MDAGAQRRDSAESAEIFGAMRGDAVGDDEGAEQGAPVGPAVAQLPGDDDLVTDIGVDLAAAFCTRPLVRSRMQDPFRRVYCPLRRALASGPRFRVAPRRSSP
ncbi:MAG TPA: hypothetical protein VHT04_07755 [Stellaceae bacterium]|jgi:hypothetical protein|nr:hypothetical protein [Stellaceae bacterium]